MDTENERDDNGQEATVNEALPPELVDIERYFASRAGLGMWISVPGCD